MEERSRSKRRAFLEREKISRKSLNGKLTQPSEERERLSKNCVKLRLKSRQEIWKNADTVFQEIKQEFESQRFQLHQASRWADQARRDKISLYGELELRNMLFQEDHARDCQEIEVLRRICCEDKIEQDKQELMNCVCIKRGIVRL